jgi:hypothetical protein
MSFDYNLKKKIANRSGEPIGFQVTFHERNKTKHKKGGQPTGR